MNPQQKTLMKAKFSDRSRGFTLLELLVVILIMAVLVSIISAVVNKAITRAIWTKTSPQMVAILTNFTQYATDHNGHYPPAYFPNGGSDTASGEEVKGSGRWLDETIFGVAYPDKATDMSMDEAATRDGDDTTSGTTGGNNGEHLRQTIFEVPASVRINERDKNMYNHSYCLNKDLITDSIQRTQPQPEFSSRRQNLYPDDAATMLIVEGSEGNMNSVGADGWSQIQTASLRYNGKFVHVGFMDGHVERVKIKDFPRSGSGSDEDSFFWHGVNMEAYRNYQNSSGGKINY
jgi:prepilin-type N-terminal cleavage/methylation domain-containing protein/prepilin-type processing-associated H-X9-DG protein